MVFAVLFSGDLLLVSDFVWFTGLSGAVWLFRVFGFWWLLVFGC